MGSKMMGCPFKIAVHNLIVLPKLETVRSVVPGLSAAYSTLLKAPTVDSTIPWRQGLLL